MPEIGEIRQGKDISEDRLRVLYSNPKLPVREIAKRLDCDLKTLYSRLRRFDIPLRGNFLQRARHLLSDPEIKRLYCEEKESSITIAEKLGLSPSYTIKRLRKMGLVRERSESGKISYTQGRKKPTQQKGEHSKNWKGGRITTVYGYVRAYAPHHPFADNNGYVLEHRLLMEKKLGRYLLPTETVHHINGIKDDNRLENLRLVSPADHQIYNKLCQHCELRKEIRFLRWQIQELSKQLQGRLI